VHFVNPIDVLPSDCTLFAAGGTPIEVLGHCRIPIQLENSFFIDTDFIISPSIKEPMLGVDWLTKNAAFWNFLEGTIIIQNPDSSVGETHSSHAVIGKKLSVISVYTWKNDCTELAEQGDFVRLILTNDSIMSKPKKHTDSRFKDISSEQGDFFPK